jgi:AraC family transcriptional regulator of adaptative response / DNA-3-methyladenine glycosylase II
MELPDREVCYRALQSRDPRFDGLLFALREMDAFPASDIGLLRGAATIDGTRSTSTSLLNRAESWRPWRAYAAQHLWAADTTNSSIRRSPHD